MYRSHEQVADLEKETGMQGIRVLALAILVLVISVAHLGAQGFSSGSDGRDGALNVTETTTLDLPADGIFRFTTVTVASGVTLQFNRNPLNTPVYILATGNINILGAISVSGREGTSFSGGQGGPGGFDGGLPGIAGSLPGAGYGPGAGLGGDHTSDPSTVAGSGAYGGLPSYSSARNGAIYGSPLLVPLIGGSGSSGTSIVGGGGGGGAILLASDTRVHISGSVQALGSRAAFTTIAIGSGGAIRIVSPIVSGNGALIVSAIGPSGHSGGHGRVRIDLLDRSALQLSIQPPAALSVGAFMLVFPPVVSRLDLIAVAGQTIPEGTSEPVLVTLPFNAPTNHPVTVQARDFSGVVPIEIVLTPDIGDRIVYPADINMSDGNPAQVTVNVDIPVNVRTQIHAWTRTP